MAPPLAVDVATARLAEGASVPSSGHVSDTQLTAATSVAQTFALPSLDVNPDIALGFAGTCSILVEVTPIDM